MKPLGTLPGELLAAVDAAQLIRAELGPATTGDQNPSQDSSSQVTSGGGGSEIADVTPGESTPAAAIDEGVENDLELSSPCPTFSTTLKNEKISLSEDGLTATGVNAFRSHVLVETCMCSNPVKNGNYFEITVVSCMAGSDSEFLGIGALFLKKKYVLCFLEETLSTNSI